MTEYGVQAFILPQAYDKLETKFKPLMVEGLRKQGVVGKIRWDIELESLTRYSHRSLAFPDCPYSVAVDADPYASSDELPVCGNDEHWSTMGPHYIVTAWGDTDEPADG